MNSEARRQQLAADYGASLQAICGVALDGPIGPETLRAVNNSSAAKIISQLCDRRMAMLQSLPTWKSWFTGKKLSDYLGKTNGYIAIVNARAAVI